MQVLKYALYGVTALIVLVLVRGFFMPSTWTVERSITIQAEPAAILPHVADLKRWPEWMPWNQERDPSAQFSFSGEGVGAVMSWSGKKLGKNRLTLTASDPRTGVGYELCLAGREDPGRGTLRLEPRSSAAPAAPADARTTPEAEARPAPGAGARPTIGAAAVPATEVVWHDTGDVGWNPIYRLLVPVIEPALGRDFALGLERLKQRVEAAR